MVARAASDIGTTPLTRRFVAAVLDGLATRPREELHRAACRARFDHLACATAGRVVPAVAALRGATASSALEQVAALEAAAAHALDRDDIHWPSLTHPGGVVWPVILALVDESGAGDAEVELAAYAGYEAMTRLALAFGSEHRRYWHATATAGTVGAAVAAAVLLGLDELGTTRAAEHAASVAGGSILCIVERSGTRIFHRMHAVATGIAAARAARAGLRGTSGGLEGERGLFAAMGGDAEPLLEAPGLSAIEGVSFRLHASTGFAHAAIEAAQELAPVDASARVVVEVPAAAAALSAGTRPQTDDEAWWSIPYAVAGTLLGLDLEDRSLLGDPSVRALLARIELVAGSTSRVTVDGRSAERSQPRAATDGDLIGKWRTLNPGAEPPVELLC